ncbi:MAG: hypothetical protein ACRCSB_00190 [Bacteroidales bacterium]
MSDKNNNKQDMLDDEIEELMLVKERLAKRKENQDLSDYQLLEIALKIIQNRALWN